MDADESSGSEIIKLFFLLNLAKHEIYPAHTSKMPTNVGSLTFICMINTISQGFKAKHIVNIHHNTFNEHLESHA